MNPNHNVGQPVPAVSKKVAYTGTAGTTDALSSTEVTIRVVATTDCFIEIGIAPTAVADTGMYLPALTPEYFMCPAGCKVSAIQVSAGGTIYVTPFA
jgi:hypothetical protein